MSPTKFDKSRITRTKAILIHLIVLTFFMANTASIAAEHVGSSSKPIQTKDGSAVVYVIDKSSSMFWIFDELKGTLKKAVGKCGPEDSLSIILFGDTVTTVVRYKSMDESKKEIVSRLMGSVYADALYTNLAPAVGRGTEYLYDYSCGKMADDYTLVLVTDGKNHPPPDYVQEYSIEEALTQFSDFFPGQQWSLRYIALKGQIDPELLALVKKYHGGVYDVEKISKLSHLTEEEVVSSIIENPEVWEPFEAVIVDVAGTVKVRKHGKQVWTTIRKGMRQKVFPGDHVVTNRNAKAVISFGKMAKMGLGGDTEISLDSLQELPLKKSSTIQISLKIGTLWNAISAPPDSSISYEVSTPITLARIKRPETIESYFGGEVFSAASTSEGEASGAVLRMVVDLENLGQTMAVLEGSAEISPLKKGAGFEEFTLSGGNYWVDTLAEKPSGSIPIPGPTVFVAPTEEEIVLGPIKAKYRFSQEYPLELSGKYPGIAFEWARWKKVLVQGVSLSAVNFEAEAISAEAVLDLPPGATLNVDVLDVKADELKRNLSLSLVCQPFFRHKGSKDYSGHIRLMCADPDVKFTRAYVDLRLVNPRLPIVLLYLVIGAVALVVAFFVGLAFWRKSEAFQKHIKRIVKYARDKAVKAKLVQVFRARPSGHIVLRKAPSVGGRKVFDLAEVSRQSDRIVLEIGADPSNPISLPHPSVLPIHCAIWASRKRYPTRIYIEPRSKASLTVNGEPVEGARQLKDKDVIEIGKYELEFKDIQYHRQVEVHMNDGQVYDGILEYWDVGQSVFYMTHTSDDEEKFVTLFYRDLSYAHFYRDESERTIGILSKTPSDSRSKHSKAVRITLTSEEKLEGFVHKDYHPGKKSAGVFLMPDSDTAAIQHTFIPATSIKEMKISKFE